MGGYGFMIGKGKEYSIWIHINLSNEYPVISFELRDKDDNYIDDFENWAKAKYGTPLEKAVKQMEEEYHLNYLGDKILHEKAVFEKRFLEMEKEIVNLKMIKDKLEEKLDNIKRLL